LLHTGGIFADSKELLTGEELLLHIEDRRIPQLDLNRSHLVDDSGHGLLLFPEENQYWNFFF